MTILANIPVKQTANRSDLEIEMEDEAVEKLLNSCLKHINEREGHILSLWFNYKLKRLMVKSK
jgi:hypothetical protein